MKDQLNRSRFKPVVAHIISGLGTGGAERSLYNIANSHLSQTHSFIVISLRGGGIYEEKLLKLGCNLKVLNLNKFNFLYKLCILLYQLRKVHPDIIQGWMYHGNVVAGIMKLFLGSKPKLIFNVRHSLYSLKLEKPFTRLTILLNKYLTRIADKVIFNSNSSMVQHHSYGFAKIKSNFIGNGFIDNFQPSQANRLLIRNELNIKKDNVVIGHVARFHPMKGHEAFILSAINILNRNLNVKFLMIGKGVDFLNKELSKLIPEQYRQNFILLGEVENVMDYMQAMEIFCISSFWGEGFPNVLGEAMLAELPCVVTNIGDSAQVLGECGSIIDMPITEEKITNNLIEMIKLSKVDLKKIGNKGRQRIIENFSIEQTLKKYQMLYTEVLE